MIIIPAVDILDHKVVQLVGGVPGSERIILPDPVAAANGWIEKGAEYLHIVDLDGAFGKGDNLTVIKRITKEFNIPVQVGGGIRDERTINELLSAGVEKVILGTKAVLDLHWLTSMAEMFPDRILLALDTKNGEIVVKGWKESAPISLKDMFTAIEDVPLAGVLNTNVDVEGQGKGINGSIAKEFISQCPHPVIASGGISNENDASVLSKAGAEGAVVGISIYTGMFEPWKLRIPWRI